jgi:hypothetical protein
LTHRLAGVFQNVTFITPASLQTKIQGESLNEIKKNRIKSFQGILQIGWQL